MNCLSSLIEKYCPSCKQTLPIASFYKNSYKKSGYRSSCIICEKRTSKESRQANPEKWREYNRAWAKSEHGKNLRRQKKYGLSPENYENLKSMSNGSCFVCGSLSRVFIDHNHQTGEVRGLLCDNCNKSAGYLGDNPVRIHNLADYISNPQVIVIESR